MSRFVALGALMLTTLSCTPIYGELPVERSLLRHRVSITSGDTKEISGYVYRPQKEGRRPAIVMLHGCSGLFTKKYGRLKTRERAWRDIFLAEGYVVLLLDSFTERGHRSICKIPLRNRPVEPDQERPHDAYGALQWLQRQTFVAPDKIALGGWSNGAMSMLWTVLSNAPQRPGHLVYDFRAAFGFYPGCIKLRTRHPNYTALVRTLLLLGADDNWTWPKPCERLGASATSKGSANVTVKTYKGATHGFDHPKLKRRTIIGSDGRWVQIGTHQKARKAAIRRIKSYLRNAFAT